MMNIIISILLLSLTITVISSCNECLFAPCESNVDCPCACEGETLICDVVCRDPRSTRDDSDPRHPPNGKDNDPRYPNKKGRNIQKVFGSFY